MKFIVTKASDIGGSENIIELNSLEDLKDYIENLNIQRWDGKGYISPRIIIQKTDLYDYETDISSVDMAIVIYDDYIE